MAQIGDIPAGAGRAVQIGEVKDCSLFCNSEGKYFAAGALCPHQNEPLDLGRLEGSEVVCRAHHLRFDLATGRCTNAGGYSLQVFDVRIVDNWVEIGLWQDE